MAQLTINATEYPLISLREVGEVLERQRRTQSQNMHSALQGDDARGKTWDAELGFLTSAQFATLDTLLTGTSAVTVAGDQIGSPSVSCYAEPQDMDSGPVADTIVLSVRLREIGGS